jgi:cyclic lactone autoinducer peptide
MKAKLAVGLNLLLMAVGSFFVFTNSWISNRPETPQELLKK